MPERHVICGGTGAIGRRLAASLEADGRDVTIVGRHGPTTWDELPRVIEAAASVVNLAGKPVGCRWTASNLRAITASRVKTTAAVRRAVEGADRPPRAWVQASAVGLYGSRGDEVLDESEAGEAAGEGVLADVCRAWEAEATGARIARIGVVLQRDAGAWPVLTRLAKIGLGGRAGDGRQWVPWVDVRDAVRALRLLIDRGGAGAFNVCSPGPVRNAELMRQARRAVGARAGLATPAWAIRVARRVAGVPDEPALASLRCVPRRLLDAGFRFDHPTLDGLRVDDS